MMRHLVLTISEKKCSGLDGWENLPENIKE